ncbi:MAG: aspartyl/glutamyl-tRNA amidotransferase subunit B [Thiotrichales bacterium 32-46-8]|nr:Asp-tRNA(Asn)/Glu-tRNA(Gln) amidotransferase subunit GatB [Gammaproteobacteria bacterium]OYX07535.1 MAG: aspartyl/glutamyl-tRNA amidotransferase subunit B [Thiotrichales bacterium 32-46-8]OYY22847.1 MAG: aspartyl/glutamyl-tRNA amidotransferase subunit B [Thiotrichales bacterium 35-46-9]OYZ06022.1 MAG: aspartyl/glutamyl-tRNA amidotransferase subunit B [Thiotrichales bacterium 16-46-22]OZA98112.1 MAG: aspartyl/glutamyl-tRNA amidotransferase subunit B [Thiotrichales bacterium 34-46-19]OZB86445
MTWETVIGLEVHAQLATNTKIFSAASTAFGAMPNTQACLVDLGMPGVLPVLNKGVVDMAIRFGLAVGATVAEKSVFARKNYFYPDLPKGYQISQFELPVVLGGQITIEVDGKEKVINLTRAHLEEDAGKSLHEDFEGYSGIDLNRAGTPLLEIVSEPEMRSPAEAVAYAKKLHELVQYLGICDGNMQEGSFRVDANVSVRRPGAPFGTRAEIKNVNSFKFLERAIMFEVERQIDVIEAGGQVVQETRLYDAAKDETRSMRSKEEAMDYRYFPCPDLLPLIITPAMIEVVKAEMPELPDAKRARFMSQYGLNDYDAMVLTNSREIADYYEAVVAATGGKDAKIAANWVMGELNARLNNDNLSISESPVDAQRMAGLIARILDNTISGKIAKDVFDAMWTSQDSADAIIESKGLKQITDPVAIAAMVRGVIDQFPEQLAEYKGGRDKLFGFFVGEVMKATKGKANPGQVNQILKDELAK